MKKFHEFNCPCCDQQGREIRRIDLMRQCPWSIVAHMRCDPCNKNWTTYIRDESRCTPFDFFDDEEEAEYQAI